MPSPIAHLSVGYLLSRRFRRLFGISDADRLLPISLLVTGFFLFWSMLPDIDAFIGILTRNLGHWHNQGTHSLLALAVATLLGGVVLWLIVRRKPLVCFAAAFVCYGLHLLMDFFCYGRGLKLFWPWLDSRFKPHVYIFMGVHWSDGLWTPWHLLTALNEIVFVVLLVLWMRRKRTASA